MIKFKNYFSENFGYSEMLISLTVPFIKHIFLELFNVLKATTLVAEISLHNLAV